jgi:hypothetical protein
MPYNRRGQLLSIQGPIYDEWQRHGTRTFRENLNTNKLGIFQGNKYLITVFVKSFYY